MDETVKVLIGTISGFIIAFFAEPVKNYFQNRTKLHNLRISLYSELVSNYFALMHFTMDGNENDKYLLYHVPKYQLRAESYNHALQDELSLFYQLKEAMLLNVTYGQINRLIHLSDDLVAVYGKRGLKEASPIYTQHSDTFNYMFTTSFYLRAFNPKILKNLVKQKQYEEIMKKGKDLIELDAKNKRSSE